MTDFQRKKYKVNKTMYTLNVVILCFRLSKKISMLRTIMQENKRYNLIKDKN